MNKGYTIVELIVAIAISTIILSIASFQFVRDFNSYISEIEANKENQYLDEGLLIIKHFVCDNSIQLEVDNNKIIIENTNKEIEEIHLDKQNSKVEIDYYDSNEKNFIEATNVIATDIINFTVEEKKNTLYVNMTNNKGRCVYECIGVKKVY